ncbi:MAG: hypothetical protein ACXAEU_26530 [Candidatus Hodarchaeales archaeon]
MSDLIIIISNFFNLFVGFFFWIPGVYLLRNYYKTRITDYLLFSMVFFLMDIDCFLTVLIETEPYNENLLIFQAACLVSYFTLFFIFLHAIRVKWDKAPRPLFYFGISWFVIIIFSIFLLEPVPYVLDVVKLWLIDVKILLPFPFALLTQGGVVLFDKETMYQFYRPFVCGLFVYAYLTSKQVEVEGRLKIAKYLWVCSFGLIGFSNLLLLGDVFMIAGWPLGIQNIIIPFLFAVIGMVITPFIAVFFPEAVLITHTQVTRATSIYNEIKNGQLTETGKIPDFGVDKIISYLKSIPPDLYA